MGFPIWTLWGMGASALGALLFTALAFMAQSPQFLARARLSGYRLDLRARALTGYALASMFLAAGFFLAGVPLDAPTSATPTAQSVSGVTPALNGDQRLQVEGGVSLTPATTAENPEATTSPSQQETVSGQTPQSGAFDGPPPTAESSEDESSPSDSATATATTAPLATTTPSPQPTTPPTTTPTATPTASPTPTLTPTPIEGETAVIATGSSTLWLYRMPGSQQLVLARGDDTVILLSGRANQGGLLWREVRTLDGVVAWVREEFLDIGGE